MLSIRVKLRGIGLWSLMLLFLGSVACKVDEKLPPSTEFFAYHTSLNGSQKQHDRYEDLVVKFDEGQLEFRKDNAYAPVWKINGKSHAVQDLFPDREKDKNAKYTYVRVLKQSESEIIVHYKHHPVLSGIFKSIDKDPLYSGAITSRVHEIFTIKPDYTISRTVKSAEGTRYEDWIHPDHGSSQSIQLTSGGIEHGKVVEGRQAPIYPRPGIEGNPIVAMDDARRALYWSFDEGQDEHEDDVLEFITNTNCRIEGQSTNFQKGISGTALAFDGYYTSVSLPGNETPDLGDSFAMTAWIAPDAYPYNQAPVIHQSKKWGDKGFYFGLDPYGYVIFRLNGEEVKSKQKIPFGEWSFVSVSFHNSNLELGVNGKVVSARKFNGSTKLPNVPLQLGRNNELDRASDFVRENEQNIDYYVGFQGLIDEVQVLKAPVTATELSSMFNAQKPDDLTSSLALSVLPGKSETGTFGAYYTDLKLNALWNNIWREVQGTDIAVEFDEVKGAVKFWRGTNYASNWISENNIWMADQSTETWGPHGCSEHMADKQNRQSYARIIENTPARVIVHWKYPCVDVGYINNNDETNWSDEYYYIYPDGTALRKVNFNGRGLPVEEVEEEWEEELEEGEVEILSEFELATQAWGDKMEVFREKYYRPEKNTWTEENIGENGPGFQDIQILTAPGKTALDMVDLNAMNVANIDGDVQKLQWELPNKTPFVQIYDASIELVNTKSEYKTFAIFQGGYITPWGMAENSAYTEDPFAGPWNHWPVNLLPSDGRYIVSHDRVSHFALGANDFVPAQGAIVLHGMTNQDISTLIPLARSWKLPPSISDVSGAKSVKYDKEQKAFLIEKNDSQVAFTIDASDAQPVVNPAFVISNWKGKEQLLINGNVVSADQYKVGLERDANGNPRLVLWMKYEASAPITVEIKNG